MKDDQISRVTVSIISIRIYISRYPGSFGLHLRREWLGTQRQWVDDQIYHEKGHYQHTPIRQYSVERNVGLARLSSYSIGKSSFWLTKYRRRHQLLILRWHKWMEIQLLAWDSRLWFQTERHASILEPPMIETSVFIWWETGTVKQVRNLPPLSWRQAPQSASWYLIFPREPKCRRFAQENCIETEVCAFAWIRSARHQWNSPTNQLHALIN